MHMYHGKLPNCCGDIGHKIRSRSKQVLIHSLFLPLYPIPGRYYLKASLYIELLIDFSKILDHILLYILYIA